MNNQQEVTRCIKCQLPISTANGSLYPLDSLYVCKCGNRIAVEPIVKVEKDEKKSQ
jgi:hypothetical protein